MYIGWWICRRSNARSATACQAMLRNNSGEDAGHNCGFSASDERASVTDSDEPNRDGCEAEGQSWRRETGNNWTLVVSNYNTTSR